MKEIRYRCWVEVDGEKFFGPGPAQLLLLIEQEGAVAKAAKKMGMSYKKAWELVNRLNSKSRQPFVVLQKGGEKGGGATLTPTGREFLAHYQQLCRKLQAVVDAETGLTGLI